MMISPKATLLELPDYSTDPRACCSKCMSRHGNVTIPSDCTGPRGQWLETQINRFMSLISSHTLPLVVKNQQTFGGGGTFVVTSQQDLLELQDTLSNRSLPKLLSQVNSSDAHLKPATLTLSEMVTDPYSGLGPDILHFTSG